MNRLAYGLLLGGVASVCVVGLSGAVFAADTAGPAASPPIIPGAPARGQGLEEIVVTAQRRSESIQKVPITVTAIGADTIRKRGIVNIADLQNIVPGLKVGEFTGASNISIRGVGTAFVSGAGQSSVAVYNDGIYLAPVQSFSMGQGDLASIEVLEGPQGTLYGRNSTGGVVSFTSNRPTDHFTFGASSLFGNYSDFKEQGYVSGPVTDHIRVRLYLEEESRDGWTLNDDTGQKLNGTNNFGGRFSVDADVLSNWKTELRMSTFKDDFSGPEFDGFYPAFSLIPAPYNDFNPYRVNSPVHYGSARTNTVVSLKNIVQLANNIVLTSTTGFNDYLESAGYDGISNTLSPEPAFIHRRSDVFTQEFNLAGKTPDLKWLAGVFLYSHATQIAEGGDETNLFGLAPVQHISPGPPATSVLEFNDVLSHEYSASAFADATYTVFEKTRIYGGLRLTWDEVRQQLTQGTAIFGHDIPGGCNPTADPERVSNDSITGRAGVERDLTASSMVYGQYSHGLKTPGFSETLCGNRYLPETIDAFEIGYKSQWFDHRLTFDADAFHYSYRDQQLEIATLIGIPVVNVPKSHVWGLESTIAAQLLPDIRVDGGIVVLDAVYDQFRNQDPENGVAVGTNLAGIELDNSPKMAGNVGIEYRHDFEQLGKFTLRAETSLTTRYQVREVLKPYAIQQGYAMVNLYATYLTPDGHYSVRFFAKNLNNVVVLQGELGFGGALGSFGPPQTYGGEVSVNF